jgi:thymidylate synthase
MRSNDVYFGLRNDLSYFIYLQKYVASRLNIPVGTYTHFAMSMHVYDRDFDIIKSVAYGTSESEKYKLNVTNLLKQQDELIDWIDNKFTSKTDFEALLKDKGVIYV